MANKCEWQSCKYNKNKICKAKAIELETFTYEEANEEFEGLKCTTYIYDPFWDCEKGREVDVVPI